jgi:hypothetical protein
VGRGELDAAADVVGVDNRAAIGGGGGGGRDGEGEARDVAEDRGGWVPVGVLDRQPTKGSTRSR